MFPGWKEREETERKQTGRLSSSQVLTHSSSTAWKEAP